MKAATTTTDEQKHKAQEKFDPAKINDEYFPDLERIARQVAKSYIDQGNVNLHLDELVCWALFKLAKINHRIVEKKTLGFPTRGDFFSYWKVTCVNAVKGAVQKQTRTTKRTGYTEHKQPTEFVDEEGLLEQDRYVTPKAKIVHIDDEEAQCQLGDEGDSVEVMTTELDAENFKAYLTPLEVLVFENLQAPRAEGFWYYISETGKMPANVTTHTVRNRHSASGLGISEALYNETIASIQSKFLAMKSETDIQFYQALAELESIFDVGPVPRNIDKLVIRRLFTVACIRNVDLMTARVTELMGIIEAKIPFKLDKEGGTISCADILHNDSVQACAFGCTYAAECKANVLKHGLNVVVPSLERVNAIKRVPVLAFSTRQDAEATVETLSDDSVTPTQPTAFNDTVLTHLTNHYAKLKIKKNPKTGGDRFGWKIKNKHGKPMIIFTTETIDGNIVLKFCAPTEKIRKHLDDSSKMLKPETSIEDALKIISQHASEAYKRD